MSDLDPASTACLARTRSAVLNLLVAVGAGIAVSGLFLGRRDRGALLWPDREAGRWAHGVLLGLIVVSFMVRRVMGGRSSLREPEQRAGRFFWSHVASAAVGALAVPLGLAYGWAIRPRLEDIAPFWVSALALGVLAIPRAYELDDFNEPLNESTEPRL
jgi:uncharacterized membrane protein YfcA